MLSQAWYRTFNDIRKLNFGSFVPSMEMLSYITGLSSIGDLSFWATTDDITAPNWCPGEQGRLPLVQVPSAVSWIRTQLHEAFRLVSTANSKGMGRRGPPKLLRAEWFAPERRHSLGRGVLFGAES